LIAPVDRPERFTPEERLDVAALAAALRGRGLEAEGPLEPDAILERLLEGGRKQDRVVVMSNGAFGGLPGKLARALGKQEREA
jgi:aspartate aminotransferase-like enzyme